MDNFDNSKIPGSEDREKPIPFDDYDTNKASISRSPLNLGGGTAGAPTAKVSAQPPGPVAKNPAEKMVPSERITGVKSFFTKLHPGAIDFLDEQITNWLNNNPSITIKRTNTVVGEVQAKKTEPNIIVTIWY